MEETKKRRICRRCGPNMQVAKALKIISDFSDQWTNANEEPEMDQVWDLLGDLDTALTEDADDTSV